MAIRDDECTPDENGMTRTWPTKQGPIDRHEDDSQQKNTHLDPLALHFIKLEEILEVHAQMAVDAEAAEPAAAAFALGIGVAGAIGRGADKQPAELARGVLHLARYPVARPPLASLQLLGGLGRRRSVVVRTPVARRPQLQIEFLP